MFKLLVAAALAASAYSAAAFDIGINLHLGGGADTVTNERIATLMQERNLKSARMDLFHDYWDMAGLRDQVRRINAKGGRVQMVVSPPFHTTKDTSCNQDLASMEATAYRQTFEMVNLVKDIVRDFEILNEVQHRRELVAEVPHGAAGTTTRIYNGKPCHATLAAVLRGMSRAIVDLRRSSRRPLRIIFGLLGKDFGLATWLARQGVTYDVVGYHAYPYIWERTLSTSLWHGRNGAMGELAKFNKPVHLNEFNCGEIYQSDYRNTPGDLATEMCLSSLVRHMKDLKTQTRLPRLEEVHLYQMRDEPTWGGAEGRFGLMYDLNRPKINLALVSAFSGGALSPTETTELTSKSLLTLSEIAHYRAGATRRPVTPPPPVVANCTAPRWVSTKRYVPGDTVSWRGELYQSTGLTATAWNENSRPDWTPKYWTPVLCAPSCTATQWVATKRYVPGDRVSWLGKLYQSSELTITAWNQNSRPDWTPQYWTAVLCGAPAGKPGGIRGPRRDRS